MLRFSISGVLLILTATVAAGASLLEQRLDELRRTSPAVEAGVAGIEVVQLATGKVLYSLNSDKLLIPASNTKLFTTALALARLGADYRLTTRIRADRASDSAGRIDGDLVLVGGGDPSMSFVAIPYAKGAQPADPLTMIDAFAESLASRGIRSISGDIVGDDSAFPADFFPPGWAQDDTLWDYGAPVSALCLGDNSVRVDITPGPREGDPATLRLTPRLAYFLLDNRIRTVASGAHGIEVRRFGGRQLEFAGTIALSGPVSTEWLAVDDPALYAAWALDDALVRHGIAITGRPVARHRYRVAATAAGHAPAGVTLLEHQSPPLGELLRVTDKISQNLWAELMLRAVARERTGDGSLGAGLKELKGFLDEIGVPDTDYVFEDGSGLSRLTLVKPDAVVRLLRFMKSTKAGELWTSLLPVGGQDGTLEKRFSNPAAKSIHAKTGSLSHVNALAGYVDSATYGELVFSIIVNATNAPSSAVRLFIDKIGMTLVE